MTTPTANKSTTKSVPTKPATPEVKEELKSESAETPVSRIPKVIAENAIFNDFCQRYLDVFDKISSYNKEVLAEKDSEWNAAKVLVKARELANPTDANVKPNEAVKAATDAWEKLVDAAAKARKAVLDVTSKELGINLSAVADRDPAVETSLKEERKSAIEIGSQLSTMAKLMTNAEASKAIEEFFGANGMPAIGRDQVRTFGNDGKSTPKYRVAIVVKKGEEVLLSESGFTKTALELTKPVFGYDRGQSLKSEDLRKAWESAGNTPDNTVKTTVEFEHNGLTYTITKK